MDGDFNIAVAEFAVLDAEGNLTNDDHEGGARIAERIGSNLEREFARRPEVLVWFDSPELESEHNVTIGVAGSPPLDVKTPTEMAEELNADMIVYGLAEPSGSTSDLTFRFYLRPQFRADFSQMVGDHEFKADLPVLDASDPAEDVWRNLDPLANALAWLILGLRQEILGEQDQAVASFAEAASFAPDSDVIQYFVGQEHFYSAQRDPSKAQESLPLAEAAFAESLRLNPDNPRARIGQGSVHFVQAQSLLNEVRSLPDGEEKTTALETVRLEAQTALDAYTDIAGQPEQINEYGVPVAGIARVGRAISLRLLAEVAFFQGDLTAAETHIDQAIAALEDDLEQLNTANDPRLAGQTYQAIGSFYEWKAFLLNERGATDAAASAREAALSFYNDCVQQGEDFPADTYLVERIVQGLCAPRIALLQQG
jgi:tetratricopeptide (TPR) repeat protein